MSRPAEILKELKLAIEDAGFGVVFGQVAPVSLNDGEVGITPADISISDADGSAVHWTFPVDFAVRSKLGATSAATTAWDKTVDDVMDLLRKIMQWPALKPGGSLTRLRKFEGGTIDALPETKEGTKTALTGRFVFQWRDDLAL